MGVFRQTEQITTDFSSVVFCRLGCLFGCYNFTANFARRIGCPVFNGMGVFICNISTVAFAFYYPPATTCYPLFPARCIFSIVPFKSFCRARKGAGIPKFRRPTAPIRKFQKSIRSQKKFPGAGPRAYCICNTVCKTGDLAPGKVSQGEAPEGCASPEEANPSKVFFSGGTPYPRGLRRGRSRGWEAWMEGPP